MTTFLGLYKGAEIYEVDLDPSEGEKLGSKVIAKARIPGQKNLKVDFVEEASDQEEALEKVNKTIDKYLEEHELKEFVIDNH